MGKDVIKKKRGSRKGNFRRAVYRVVYPLAVVVGFVAVLSAALVFAAIKEATTNQEREVIDAVSIPPSMDASLISEVMVSEMRIVRILAESQDIYEQATSSNQLSDE